MEELLKDKNHDWAEILRDQLGLGHYSPAMGGPPIEIMVMRYTVKEAMEAFPGGKGHPAVPTVLDSDMSPFFFPSPKPGPEADANPYYGHAVNLTSVDKENDYKIGVELLHPRLD